MTANSTLVLGEDADINFASKARLLMYSDKIRMYTPAKSLINITGNLTQALFGSTSTVTADYPKGFYTGVHYYSSGAPYISIVNNSGEKIQAWIIAFVDSSPLYGSAVVQPNGGAAQLIGNTRKTCAYICIWSTT